MDTKLCNSVSANCRKRRRTKKLLKDIKEQVEFYFSDANLHHDKFLMEYVGSDGCQYVSLELLLSFKRLREMCTTQELLQKAIQESSSLQLSMDMKMVRRKAKSILSPSYNADHCTIFMESLPANTTVQWIKEFCCKLGPVRYISLPRFRSGSIKGYAFVEFMLVEDAILACSVLNAPPKNFYPKLNQVSSSQPMQKLCNKSCQVVNTPAINKENQRTEYSHSKPFPGTKRTLSDEHNVNNCKRICLINNFKPSCTNDKVTINMCKLSSSVECENSQNTENSQNNLNSEHPHIEESNNQLTEINVESDESDSNSLSYISTPSVKSKVTCVKENNRRKRISTVSLSLFSENENQFAKVRKDPSLLNVSATVPQSGIEVTITKKMKHNRKRKRKHRLISVKSSSKPDVSIHAMSKLEWMELKKQYLHVQRDNMGKLKSILQKSAAIDSETTSVYIKRHIALNNSANESCTDDNEVEYNMNDKTNITEKRFYRSVSHSAPSFVPGVIAFLSSLDINDSTNAKKLMPLPSLIAIKNHFSQYGSVAYVDIKLESTAGYIRFEDTMSAQRAILEEKKFGLRLLTGIEEESYWDALLISRQLKRSRERKKISGKEKLVSKAEQIINMTSKKHIKFNSDF